MIKIKEIQIKRFRSIMDLKINIDNIHNYICFCGENNTGKTNTLRAINLFFNPEIYKPEKDAPNHKYSITRGESVFPEITINFIKGNDIYSLKRKFDKDGIYTINGLYIEYKKGKKEMTDLEIKRFLSEIAILFIESANISIPQIINTVINDLYDIEYANSQFRGYKQDLKNSFDNYTQGLLKILSDLSSEITPEFKKYNEQWGIDFQLNSDIKKFRDLITDDIIFYVNDKSNQKIEGKGAGLQRLAYLLLTFRIISKIRNKSIILLIDEPDVYLHEGIQKILYTDIMNICKYAQVFITTHSKSFIDTYTLKNVFLLDLRIKEQYSERKKVNYNILESFLVDLDNEDGARKIKKYLGIENPNVDILNKNNILVEGSSDKIYLEELSKYFGIELPKITPVHGVDNFEKYLEYYNSSYKNTSDAIVPNILIIIDNDNKGREIYKKLSNKISKYLYIKTKLIFIPNFLGETPDNKSLDNNPDNIEIEDFIYPKLFCYMVNLLLKSKKLNTINIKTISSNIQSKVFKRKGILNMIEYEKNLENKENGDVICFDNSTHENEKIKMSLAGFFNLKADKQLSKLIEAEDLKYQKPKEFLISISEDKIKFLLKE